MSHSFVPKPSSARPLSPQSSTYNVFIVHPTPLVILSIKTIIQANKQLAYIGASHTPIWLEPDIDLVVMEANKDHFEWVKEITSASRPVRVVMLSKADEPALVSEAIRHGVTGYISAHCSPSELAEAMMNVAQNMNYIGEEFATKLYATYTTDHSPKQLLTDRQLMVLQLLSRGLSNQQISEQCNISRHTVRNHLQAIYRQLDVNNRSAAIVKACELEIVSL